MYILFNKDKNHHQLIGKVVYVIAKELTEVKLHYRSTIICIELYTMLICINIMLILIPISHIYEQAMKKRLFPLLTPSPTMNLFLQNNETI